MGRVERGKRVEQRSDGAGRDHADHDPAPDQAVHVVHRLPQSVDRRERVTGVSERGRSGGGHRAPAARSVEEDGPELVFELSDLGTDAGLADVYPLGRTGEVRLLGDRDEVFKLSEFHICGF